MDKLALIQPDLSDGFVNLWSILEVASSDTSSDSKIKNVVYSILPILQNEYIIKCFSSIWIDILDNMEKTDIATFLDVIKEGENNPLNKVIAFTLLPQYEQFREDFFEKLKDYPVIRQKIYRLYLMKDKKNKMIEASELYAQRIEWHLYRLYRVRNAIVHAGDTDRYIRVLGEHLHIYCDSVIMEVVFKLTEKNSLLTVKDVLIDTRMLLEKKKDYFSSGGAFVDQDIECLCKKYFI